MLQRITGLRRKRPKSGERLDGLLREAMALGVVRHGDDRRTMQSASQGNGQPVGMRFAGQTEVSVTLPFTSKPTLALSNGCVIGSHGAS